MADKDDVKPDIEEQETASDEKLQDAEPADEIFGPERAAGEGQPIEPAKSGVPQRLILLLLLLLLVLVGAAAWFYFNSPQEQAAAPGAELKPPVQSKTLPIPAREPAPEAAEPKKAPAVAVPLPETTPVVEDSPVAGEDLKETAEAAEPVIEQPLPVVAPQRSEEMEAARAPVAEVPGEPTAAPTDKAAEQPASPTSGQFTIQVGAYAVQSHLAAAQEKIRELGHAYTVRETTTKVDMVRLRVGTFFPSQGEAKMAEIRLQGGEPFFLMDKDLMVVYAGSFQNTAKARQFAETLQGLGIHTAEETVATEVPLNILRFGDFATRAEAEEAAAKARQRGLDTLIVKIR
jgi:septal ring-binding cell division protein DamX